MQMTYTRRAGVALIGLALIGSACGSKKTSTTAGATTVAGASGAGVTCTNISFAFLGALSGDNGNLGKNMVNGATIAIEEFNKANPKCQVKWDSSTQSDSQGDPKQAPALADKIVSDKNVVALIGPGFSGETKAVMPTLETATLPMVTPGATNAKLSTNGWKMFHRILANDDKQAPGIVKYIQSAGFKKVGVIDDASEYGKGLADSVRSGLAAVKAADATVDPKAADFSAAIATMKGAGVDAVFYGGYYAEAAKMVTQLKDAGLTAKFISGDGSLDVGFVKNAGPAAEGSVLTATGAPADVNPGFQAKFKAKFGSDPALYSPEAYDCATIFLEALKAGKTTRADIAAFASAYDKDGITKHIKFDATGEPAGEAVFYTVVEKGALVSKGLIK